MNNWTRSSRHRALNLKDGHDELHVGLETKAHALSVR